jgi:seryl-tRNA synthetase
MHDLKLIRENPTWLDNGLERRNMPHQSARIVQLDAQRRALQTRNQEIQQKLNEFSKKIGELKRTGLDVTQLMQEVVSLKETYEDSKRRESLEAIELESLLATVPNIPANDVPYGKDETSNLEIRKVGEPRRVNSAKEHYEIGEKLGLMDFETAAKLSGARFTILKGHLAQLERALGNFMLDVHTTQFGYTEISPPLIVQDHIMFGTGQLPKFRDDQFIVSRHNDVGQVEHTHWLIPTAEVPLTNIVYDSIVEAEGLPYRFVARTPCFRAEAGAAGKDTRGMIRQHQFYKVELVSITTPDQSNAEHERMTEAAETILKKLEIPFRTVLLCTGDMGFSSRKTYDIEAWLPGQNAYREISSCSNCGDFQARRMKARFRAKGDKNTQFLHTLNGSGVAVGRALIAVLENYQQDDGSVAIPSALKPYMGGVEKISA